MTRHEVYADALLGRKVVALDNRPVGRIEELHAEQHGDYFDVVEFVIGSAGLLERLNVGIRRLFGRSRKGDVARWDQIDISDPRRPRLKCSVKDLRPLER
jgi:hypothetical protein